MVLGRLWGWILLGCALLLASGDAVMALGPGDHAHIATSDLITLLSGRPPQPDTAPLQLAPLGLPVAVQVNTLPVWTWFGIAGVTLLVLFRRRPTGHGRRRPRSRFA